MLWLLLTGIFIIFVIIIILSLRIKINVHYTLQEKEQKLQIVAYLGKIRIIDKELPIDQTEQSIFSQLDENLELELDSFMKTIGKALNVIRKILHHTKLHQLEWFTHVGTGEASTTGVASGMLWALKGTIVGYVVEKLILHCNPSVQVEPKYQQLCFQTSFDCMISIRLGKAIQGLIQINRLVKEK